MKTAQRATGWHWLPGNKASHRPKYILFLDVESVMDQDGSNLRTYSFNRAAVCLCEYIKTKGLVKVDSASFDSTEALWRAITIAASDAEKLLVVSHNIDQDARLSNVFT
ncbi:MAG: hypothetical protein KKF27_20170 [Gammaproteobacteria bacterium]|nr:hypothetical protein [Gammaproteobacteria bacterium]